MRVFRVFLPLIVLVFIQPTSTSFAQDNTVLRVGTVGEPSSLDPATSGDGASGLVFVNMLEGLFEWEIGPELLPRLAADMGEFSEDGLQFTVSLRQGVLFHDGTPFNADAVKVNFDRILDTELGLVGTSAFAPFMESINVLDDYTIAFNFSQPTYGFRFDLANSYAKMLSPASLERDAELINTRPIGTGSFQIINWLPGQMVSMAAFADYWNGAPSVDRLEYIPISEPSARSAALEAGDIDIALFLPIPDAVRLQDDPDFNVLVGSGIDAYHYQFNLLKEPMSDVRVRQALNHAVDIDSIVEFLYQGFAVPLDSPIAPTLPAYSSVGSYDYDPDRARELLAEAGYEDGLTLELWTTEGRYLQDRQLAEAIAGYMRDVGITVNIVAMENTTYVQRIRSGSVDEIPEYDMAILTAAPGSGNATQAWNLFIATEAAPPRFVNLAFYSNPDVDALIREVSQIASMEEANLLHREIQQIVWDEAPWLFLLSPNQIAASRTDIVGLDFSLLFLDVRNAEFVD